MKQIYRTYKDTEVVELGVNVACPACKREWMEYGDKTNCGETYELECDPDDGGCGEKFEMYFDAS